MKGADGGWSFEEALARTSDPRLWDRYQIENRQQAPTSAGLRRSLISELLAKIGTKLFAAVSKPTPSADEWIVLDRAALENKVVKERIEEIRFFAPLKAPFAAECLRGQGLAEAFQQYVIDDPEVTVLQERTSMRDRFEEGRCPLGASIDYHWPLETKASEFEFRLENGGILIFGGPELRPTPQVSALSEALADRISAFRSLLVSGKIQAFGLSNYFGESVVPARQWTRKNLSIDVANGDLCEQDGEGNFLPLWTGIELQSPEPEPRQSTQPAKQIASGRKRSPMGQEIERIIREHRIDVETQGRKAAAAKVARHMANPPRLADSIKALETQVARISKVVNKPR